MRIRNLFAERTQITLRAVDWLRERGITPMSQVAILKEVKSQKLSVKNLIFPAQIGKGLVDNQFLDFDIEGLPSFKTLPSHEHGLTLQFHDRVTCSACGYYSGGFVRSLPCHKIISRIERELIWIECELIEVYVVLHVCWMQVLLPPRGLSEPSLNPSDDIIIQL